jgi:hypothetical protein
MGAEGEGSSAAKLLEGVGRMDGGEIFGLGFRLGFLGFALTQGLSEFWALRSFSRAVPYFSSLAGHLLESAGWLCSTESFPRQLTHLMLWGHRPSSVVSIDSPISLAREHLWQDNGSECGWDSSSCGPLQILQRWGSLQAGVLWPSFQQLRHCIIGGRS